jgi:hypothetical protein
MFLFNSTVEAFFPKNECVSQLKTMIDMEYSYDKHTQFSKGNIVQNTQDSNLDGFVIRVTGFS